MNTSFVPSGENEGTIIVVPARPQLPGLASVTSTGVGAALVGNCQTQ